MKRIGIILFLLLLALSWFFFPHQLTSHSTPKSTFTPATSSMMQQRSLPNVVSSSSPQHLDEPKGEAHFKRVLAIQIQADKVNGKFISENESLKSFQNQCDHFSPLRGQQVFFCELMLTNFEVGETLALLFAQYRHAATDELKLQAHLSILETYAHIRNLEIRDHFLNCSNGEVSFNEHLAGDNFEVAFDGLGQNESFGTHSFDSDQRHESFALYKEQIAEHAKLRRRTILGVMVVINNDRDEIQFCPYRQLYH